MDIINTSLHCGHLLSAHATNFCCCDGPQMARASMSPRLSSKPQSAPHRQRAVPAQRSLRRPFAPLSPRLLRSRKALCWQHSLAGSVKTSNFSPRAIQIPMVVVQHTWSCIVYCKCLWPGCSLSTGAESGNSLLVQAIQYVPFCIEVL